MHRAFTFSLPIVILISLYNAQTLPTLPKRFSTIVEANIVNKNKTWIMEEWYDGIENKTRREFLAGDYVYVTYENFKNGADELWSYITSVEDETNAISCTLEPYSTADQPIPFTDQTGTGGLVSSQEWFQFGSQFQETYLGNNFQVRGIKSEAWTRNVTDVANIPPASTMTYTYSITYYFSVADWGWFNSTEHRIPVRMELKGERVWEDSGVVDPAKSYEFLHYYDYFEFLVDDLADFDGEDGVQFEIPDFYEQCNVTKYCNTYDTSDFCTEYKGPAVPTIPNSFWATWEVTTVTDDDTFGPGKSTSIGEIYYDYDKDRARETWRFLDGYYKNALHQLELIEDDKPTNQRWVWFGDGTQETPITSDDSIYGCSMTETDGDYTGFDYLLPLSNGHLVNPHRLLFFDDNRYDPGVSDVVWMGYTTIRSIPAQKWKATFNLAVGGGEPTTYLPYALPSNQRAVLNGTVYWYFSSNWTFLYDTNDTVRPLSIVVDGSYKIYNSTDSGGWKLVKNATVVSSGNVIGWTSGSPQDEWFNPPSFYRKYCDISKTYCDNANYADQSVCDEPEELPTTIGLHKAFSTFEANDLLNDTTYLLKFWYNYDKNEVRNEYYNDRNLIVTYDHLDDDKRTTWVHPINDTSNIINCTIESYEDTIDDWGGSEFAEEYMDTGHVKTAGDLFRFGEEYNVTWLGDGFTVRGIDARAWHTYNSNLTWVNKDDKNLFFTMDSTFYFADPSWNYYEMVDKVDIPLRVRYTGSALNDAPTPTGISDFDFQLEVTGFFSGPDAFNDEEMEFTFEDWYTQCDTSSYCEKYPDNDICSDTRGPALPKIPYGFSATFELTVNNEGDEFPGFPNKLTSVGTMYYDYNNDQEHGIWRFMDGYYENAYHQLELLQEGEDGQTWIWLGDGIGDTAEDEDDEITGCTMTISTGNYTGYDYLLPIQNGHVLNPQRLLLFNDHANDQEVSDETFMGYEDKRGIPCQKWLATVDVTVTGDEQSLFAPFPIADNQQINIMGNVYWYFSVANWTFGYMTNESNIPVAVEVDGTYTVSNWSSITQDYTIIHQQTDVKQSAAITSWLKGTPEDEYFKPPTYWRRYCTIDEAYCSEESDHSDHEHGEDSIFEKVCENGEDLPALPQHKYFAVLEGNDLMNETTHVLKTWYNYDQNELRAEYYDENRIITTYDDLDEDRRWTWIREINDTDNIIMCNVVPYSSTIDDNGGEEFAEEYVDIGHVKTAADLWRFGPEYNITYLGGDFTIRGINARSWHSTSSSTYKYNGTDTKVDFESIFYFADGDWDYYEGIEASDIPLAVNWKGTYENEDDAGDFDVIFHVVSFFSGPEAFDEDDMKFVFEDWYSECDTSSYCDTYPDNKLCNDARGPSMPTLPEQFYAVFEATMDTSDNMYTGTFVIEEWYDYPGNEAHVVMHTGPNWRGDAMHQLDRLDTDEKWIWFGDGDDDDSDGDEIYDCQLTPAINNFTGVDVFITEQNGHIASPSRWFRWNDNKYTSTDIWHGYTTVRGIPAEKWKSTWTEYEEIPSSPLQKTFAANFTATATYYWSNRSWNLWHANYDVVPLQLSLQGVYTLYNKSATTGKYDVFWTTSTIDATYNMMIFNANEQDEDYFQIPEQYEQCNTSLYCSKYPSSDVCTGSVIFSSDSSEASEGEGNNDNKLGAGYIVLMIILFFLGLLIGAIIDRYNVRRKGRASFQRMEDEAKAEAETDARL